MSDPTDKSDTSSGDMSDYLQMFLDETEEQLEDLVETMLLLERDPHRIDDVHEAFRLIHSIKGSAGMMGLPTITALTHELESRFERLRSGSEILTPAVTTVVLRCIDFLRECTRQMRAGQPLGNAAEWLAALAALPEHPADSPAGGAPDAQTPGDSSTRERHTSEEEGWRAETSWLITIRFEANLPLADLKARLIASRLSRLGEIRVTLPRLDELDHVHDLSEFVVLIETEQSADDVRAAASVDGVASLELAVPDAEQADRVGETHAPTPSESFDLRAEEDTSFPEERDAAGRQTKEVDRPASERHAKQVARRIEPFPSSDAGPAENEAPAEREAPTAVAPPAQVTETMRVDIDRLDSLMNLAGELVVNRARFVQVARQLSPALKKASVINRFREFGDSLRRTIDHLRTLSVEHSELSLRIQELQTGLRVMEEHSQLWDQSRHCFGQMTEAIDQLTRVSGNLQRGVLGTRMVAVAPLFNRFRRIVRDLSLERGKKVRLQIQGENTELDKRMIDELAEPLVHLVRNSIDHGLEPPDVRRQQGKSEWGTIRLEANHTGNNVYIHVHDDGRGIDVATIKRRLIDDQIITETAADKLTPDQTIDYIWHPGFSTAQEISDLSGRGVGMDAVKTRIDELNGTVEIASSPRKGTTFSLRLPLTLAIINSLLVRVRGSVFCIPMDDVREIVATDTSDVITVRGVQTMDVRGEYIPLVAISDVFRRQPVPGAPAGTGPVGHPGHGHGEHAVVLQAMGRCLGLRVDELLGSQDIVIKSLAENFTDIRGLSGASILGDGTVCLMLDSGQFLEMAMSAANARRSQGDQVD